MKRLTPEQIERMTMISEFLKMVKKRVDKCIINDTPLVDFNIKWHNTGITEYPSNDTWPHHADLGGRRFEFNIEFPNTHTLHDVMKKEAKKNAKRATTKK